MLTLGSLASHRPQLELEFTSPADPSAPAAEVAGVCTITPEALLESGVPSALPNGYMVLITGAAPFRLRGRINTVVGRLVERMAKDGCVALAVRAAPGTRQPFPPTVVNDAVESGIHLLTTSAPAESWEGVHDDLQRIRLMDAERRATELSTLVGELPAQLADPRAMQRIVEWIARVLDSQVLVIELERERVLAAAPETAAEQLAGAIIRQAVDSATVSPRPHTQLIALTPGLRSKSVLAVARRIAFDAGDRLLLGHAAKLLGLVDQALREYRAASEAERAARSAAFDLLMDGEVAKARRVMSILAPGLLEPETARVFVIESRERLREVDIRRCIEAVEDHCLVVRDQHSHRRILIVYPTPSDRGGKSVSDQLIRLTKSLGPHASLGGSGVYAIGLLADALREADVAQRFAALQPDSVALSIQDSEFVSLLPQPEAQLWAHGLMAPLMDDAAQWELMRETLPTALAVPNTVAARRLNLHRNTVHRRVQRAADLLRLDLAAIADRIAVALALELLAHRDPAVPPPSDAAPPQLEELLAVPPVKAWAEIMLKTAQGDRRALLATADCWLLFNTHVEPAARKLNVSEVTVRSHLRALERYMQRDFSTLTGARDLMFSLHVLQGRPLAVSGRRVKDLRVVA
ncbi:helix-turn-helix domain-containing protein [Streptomyces sp. NPDC059783]|uniref:helix-turn-helix domain-containing protein n=1 Tax=Streptomyces sp. NPDC059783 TaxID=3346944 RepID=UPI0036547C4A